MRLSCYYHQTRNVPYKPQERGGKMDYRGQQVFSTCRFLQLKPEKDIRNHLGDLKWHVDGGDDSDTSEEVEEFRREFLQILRNRFFFPWCKKLDQLCVTAGIIASRTRGAAPVGHIVASECLIVECDDREPCEDDPKLFEEWVIDHLYLE